MNISFIKSKILPIATILIVFGLWFSPLNLGYFIVIVPAILVIISSFVENGKKGFKLLGLKRGTTSFLDLLVYAPTIALILFSAYYFFLIPFIGSLTGQGIDFSSFSDLKGNTSYALIMLVFIWISAAFGEEIIWRGYFMKQFNKFFGKNTISLAINLLLFAILFGFMHSYQGITGQIITGIIGFTLALIFHVKKYNLWFNIAIHGFFDTFGLIAVYNGWM